VRVLLIFWLLSHSLIAAAQEATYVPLGQFHANVAGPTSLYLRLPGNDGGYRDWLSWGYDIWGDGTEPVPERGWVVTESLFEPPYNVPKEATAVHLHFKVKVAGVSWAENQIAGAIQVSARPAGSSVSPNEIAHSAAQKPAEQPGITPYDLNHVETDILLGDDGKIEILRDVSIVGDYMQIDLAVFLAGYWAPQEPPSQ
jgi:hypothetical protein